VETRVQELFHEVADLSPEARNQYFTEHGIDTTTRQKVEALLAFDDSSLTSLSSDVSKIAQSVLSGIAPKQVNCGPYRLSRLLGRGGMGAVYLGERVDGEVTQFVAVKLLRPGADDPRIRQQFLAERQILASLSHPNIARLLDAGHNEDGQPYLVMEYVEGRPLDDLGSTFSLRRKVSLFIKVCTAVGYLHRNLVIHRDLKPANILVTTDGEPKVLDFGIAKILDFNGEITATGMRMLTPDYASPEQITGRPVSTASDIYSLGAVLYFLLTGASPHRSDSDSAAPSATGHYRNRIIPPSRLLPVLKGDLEFILLKALRLEPQERYATVDQFAEDLQGYLDSRSIRARQGDSWYRTQKFLRRYWLPAAGAATAIASLATGLVVANRERAVAERRFAQLRQLSKRVIDLDRVIRTLPGSVEARQGLVSASLEYLEGLSSEARGNLDLTQEISDGYWRMARIQGVNEEFNLGDPIKAEESLRRADQLISTVLASRPEDRAALLRSAIIAHDRMVLANSGQRRSDTRSFAGQAIHRIELFLQHDDPQNPVRLDGFLRGGDARQAERVGIAALYAGVARVYVDIHMYADGARYASRATEIVEPISSAQDLASQALSVLANALRYQGDLQNAALIIRKARQTSEKATFPSETARFFSLHGVALREGRILGEADAVSLDRPTEAIAVLQQALDRTDEVARKDTRDSASRSLLATVARELGKILRDRDPPRALAVFDLGVKPLGESGSGLQSRREQALLLAHSSYSLRHLHRFTDAKTRIDNALAILQDTHDYPADSIRLASHAYYVTSALADYEAEAGDLHRAVAIYERLLQSVMAAKPDVLTDLRDTPKLSRIYQALAALYHRNGDTAKESAMNSLRLELWRHWQRELPANPFVLRQLEAVREAM